MSEKLTIEQNLSLLLETKTKMKENIIASGGTINDDTPFIEYAKYVGGASEGGASGSSGIVEVDKLPTENIENDTLYKINKISDVHIYVKDDGGMFITTLEEAIESVGVTPNITYYLVEELPSNPQSSDLATFSQVYVYIYEDIAYFYGDVGSGNMWISAGTLFTNLSGDENADKGYIKGVGELSDDDKGVYVSYTLGTYGISGIKYYHTKLHNGEWIDYEALVNKSIETFNSIATNINPYYLAGCKMLTSLDLPNAIKVEEYCCHKCSKLTNASLPNATYLGNHCFSLCHELINIDIPNVERLGSLCFERCSKLKKLDLHKINYIGSSCFLNCNNLETLIIRTTSGVCDINGTAFRNTPISSGTGYVYVPDELVTNYKSDSKWKSDLANADTQIKPLSEYVE